MPYLISSTEKTRKSASDFETKSLFYLICFGPKKDDIHYLLVDVFNDLSAHDRFMKTNWDLQSKANSGVSPKTIGKELVTLFKNYLSDFDFEFPILMLGGVTSSFRIDPNKTTFDSTNIQQTAFKNMKDGLIEEAKAKTYINNADIKDELIDDFLKKVIFVIDTNNKADYIRKAVSLLNPKIIPADYELDAIFDSIRDEQSCKKNYGNIEGKTISRIEDSLSFKRHLTVSEIQLKIIDEIIGRDIFGSGVPVYFMDEVEGLNPKEVASIVEECQLCLSKVFCDKNNHENFWNLFNEIYTIVLNNPSNDLNSNYDLVSNKTLNNVQHLDIKSTKFLIAKMMEAVICS